MVNSISVNSIVVLNGLAKKLASGMAVTSIRSSAVNEVTQPTSEVTVNVILAVENLFPFKLDYYAPLPSEIAKQLKDINHSNVKCCLDISHGYINCTYRNKSPNYSM